MSDYKKFYGYFTYHDISPVTLMRCPIDKCAALIDQPFKRLLENIFNY